MRAACHRLSLPKGLVLVALVLGSVLASAPAHADDTERAKELFQQGTTLFNIGDFDKAIEAWQQGYKEKPDPGFLWNIGQAYRLKGDNQKAIFFYRGYLRNSPKAANRAEVEAKIAALQKTANEPKSPSPPTPAPTTGPARVAAPPVTPASPPPPAPAPAAVAPPPMNAPPLPLDAPAPAVVEFPSGAPPVPPTDNRRFDLGIALGFNAWTSGLRSHADPSFAFDVAAGFTFGDVYGSSSFRLGAFIGYTSLGERASMTAPETRVGFTSLLLEPSVRIRLSDRRFYLAGGLGIGALVISSLQSTSALFPENKVAKVNGAQGAFELRPAVALQWHLSPAVVAYLSPGLSFSPKKPDYYAAIGRFEMMFGLIYLM